MADGNDGNGFDLGPFAGTVKNDHALLVAPQR